MDSYCAAPWRVHNVNANGTVGICCINHEIVAADHASLMSSRAMLDAMAAMLDGRPVRGCDKCYDQEAQGMQSLRQVYNELSGASAPDLLDAMWFDLSLGNKCNQACRICGPHNSTGWIADVRSMKDLDWAHVNNVYVNAPVVDGSDKITDIVHHMRLATGPFRVELKGGEPLYMESTKRLLQDMIALGLHKKTAQLRIITNGTASDDGMISLLDAFDDIDLAISIDAVGPLHSYTRGTRLTWDECRARWGRLLSMPNVRSIRLSNTIYAYTVFGQADLIAWKDSELGKDVPMADAVLHSPAYLRSAVLTDDLKAAARSALPSGHGALPELLDTGDAIYNAARQRFRTFTQRLDQLRGERLVDLVPELAPMMEAGRGP